MTATLRSNRSMPSTTVRIGLVQSACTGDREANISRALAGIAAAAGQGAEVVCLQELFAGEYPCPAEDHGKFAEAETVPGPLTERLAAAAKQHGVVLVRRSWWPSPARAVASALRATAATWPRRPPTLSIMSFLRPGSTGIALTGCLRRITS